MKKLNKKQNLFKSHKASTEQNAKNLIIQNNLINFI